MPAVSEFLTAVHKCYSSVRLTEQFEVRVSFIDQAVCSCLPLELSGCLMNLTDASNFSCPVGMFHLTPDVLEPTPDLNAVRHRNASSAR